MSQNSNQTGIDKETGDNLPSSMSFSSKLKMNLDNGSAQFINSTREKPSSFKRLLSPSLGFFHKTATENTTKSNVIDESSKKLPYESGLSYNYNTSNPGIPHDGSESATGVSLTSLRNDNNDDQIGSPVNVSILDDAASSICVDDYDLGLIGTAVNYIDPILRNEDVHTLQKAKDDIMKDENLTDFEKFKRQTATDMYIQEKVQEENLERERRQMRRREQRKKGRRRMDPDSSRFYGNYFTSIDPSAKSKKMFMCPEEPELNEPLISLRHRHVVKVNAPNSYRGKITNELELSSLNSSGVPPGFLNEANDPMEMKSVDLRKSSCGRTTFGDTASKADELYILEENSTSASFDRDTIDTFETIIVDVPHAGRENIYTFPSSQSFHGSYQPKYLSDERYPQGLQRKLLPRHLPSMAFGLSLGFGIFFASGSAFAIAGPLGALLAYISVAIIVLCTVLSISELITYIPMVSGIVGLSSRFVDDAFGFAIGICYWFMFAIALPLQVTSASVTLSYYPGLIVPSESIVSWITLFLMVVVIVSLLDVRIYGEIRYVTIIVTITLILGLLVLMFCSNQGLVGPRHEYIGFKYWDGKYSNSTEGFIFGPFRPNFQLNGEDAITIGGNLGRFLSVWTAMLPAAYGFLGIESVVITAAEARNPRRSIPSAVKRIFAYVLIFYILSVFALGLSIYAGDPRLLSQSPTYLSFQFDQGGSEYVDNCGTYSYPAYFNGNNSPWIIALKNAGLCTVASAYNGLLITFLISSGISALYGSSRVLYSLSENGKFFKMFATCSSFGVPYRAVLFSASFSLTAYISASSTSSKVFFWSMRLSTSAGLIVWIGMSLTYLRFYYGLKRRPELFLLRKERHPFITIIQPYTAYVSLIGTFLMMITAGFPVFLKGQWDGSQFILEYAIPLLFLVLFISYKVIFKTKFVTTQQMDLDSERLEMDEKVWEEERVYTGSTKYFLKSLLRIIT